jgi:hypothetical protein
MTHRSRATWCPLVRLAVMGMVIAASDACGGSTDKETSPPADAAVETSSEESDVVSVMTYDGDTSAALGPDASPESQPQADVGAPDGCEAPAVVQAYGAAAASTGFGGTDTAYFALFGLPCAAPADCTAPCESAGGSPSSCANGSLCLPGEQVDGGLGCLPPTYWLDPGGATSRSGMTQGAARDTQAPDNGYNDGLVVTSFGLSIPPDGTIQGIAFDVSRMADDGNAQDAAIRVIQAGMPVGTDHAAAAAWPPAFSVATYGGPTDTWGVSWTGKDFASPAFGLSITPRQTAVTGGADNVDVDSVRVTVFYTPRCD